MNRITNASDLINEKLFNIEKELDGLQAEAALEKVQISEDIKELRNAIINLTKEVGKLAKTVTRIRIMKYFF
jgi:hypothetical protein